MTVVRPVRVVRIRLRGHGIVMFRVRRVVALTRAGVRSVPSVMSVISHRLCEKTGARHQSRRGYGFGGACPR